MESLNRTARKATLHCLAGCAIGEVAGMIAGTGLHWSNHVTVVASTALAFLCGYGLTLLPLLRAGLRLRRALGLAFASDTLSIALMELVDNGLMLVLPGAMDAPLSSGLFWGALALSLALAGLAAFPLNRWLIARGRGHAVVHGVHGGHGGHGGHGAHAPHAPAATAGTKKPAGPRREAV